MSLAIEERGCSPVLPPGLRPMLAQPASGPLSSKEYAYELKWDGMRVLVGLDSDRLSLRTRNGIEALPRFPELRGLREAVTRSQAILDGEIVRMVDGRPSFWALQRRIQAANAREIERGSAEEPAELVLFDILQVDDCWLLATLWSDRRSILEQAVSPGGRLLLSPTWSNGEALWRAVRSAGLEGIVAKRRAGRYQPGMRTSDWLKIKIAETTDLVIGGWTEGSGARAGTIGALLLGAFAGQGLAYLGHVGTGFDRNALAELEGALRPLETALCPFTSPPRANAAPHWVRPSLVCEVRHQGWTAEGRLRSGVFLRLRPDKSAHEVRAT